MNRLLGCALLAWTGSALLSPATAVPAPRADEPLASVQLSATSLTVAPYVDYDLAIVRISGPDDYALSVPFLDGELIAVDLLVDAESRVDDRIGASARSPGLPDGRYRYEIVLQIASGEERVNPGLFFVKDGRPVSRDRMRASLAEANSELAGAAIRETQALGEPGASSLTIDEFLRVEDTNANYLTEIFLDVESPDFLFARWTFRNYDNDLSFVESEAPGDFQERVLFAAGGDVGIGTSAPIGRLHVVDPGFQLVLDDNSGNLHFFNQTSAALQIGRPGLLFPLVIGNDAPHLSLVLDGDGVGIGTSTPAATLHVNGGGIIEGDVALGSSREIKHEITLLDGLKVLNLIRDLSLYTWKYRDDSRQALHVGPMAEDIYDAFSVGSDDKHLSPADTAGLALAAAQGLDQRLDHELEELRSRNVELADQNTRLLQRLDAIEALLADEGRSR